MQYRQFFLFLAMGLNVSTAYADNVMVQDLNQAGFADVAKLLQSMSPAQQQAVLAQAALKQKDMQKLSPQEQQQLLEQLRAAANKVKMDKIDPAKLDVSKTPPTAEIRKDLATYQQQNPPSQNKTDNDMGKSVSHPQ